MAFEICKIHLSSYFKGLNISTAIHASTANCGTGCGLISDTQPELQGSTACLNTIQKWQFLEMCKYPPQDPLVAKLQEASLYHRTNVTDRHLDEHTGGMQSPPVGKLSQPQKPWTSKGAHNTHRRVLLSAKTCRGCRSMPKAGKWDSAAFDFKTFHCLGICA
ncbi:hypothetical protein PCH_Pc16g08370 [Penicillium rubens Wisconsin 54-1255]|uniref:Uncharacterized protein n=1 Tax=Penicillium rubens (strain ATCC 28089 / DSM 1075 / NRRL 1951 / Wisconsin 54-1255) TaxID=500485 RepID=B6H7W6_PENRW|nr:hypothetical protein PCH_Pc16g08370 [Penicillium rubens Wisconsin 54-1255]